MGIRGKLTVKANQRYLNFSVEFGIRIDSRQMAVGTRQQESKYKRAGGSGQQFGLRITRQQAVRNQPLRLGLLNSDLPTAYCYLPTSFPLRLGLPARRAYSPEGAINFVEFVLLNISKVRI